jgi:hypothetical protein
MGELHIHDGSSWKITKDIRVNVAGTWRRTSNGYVHDGTNWRQFYTYDSTGPSAVTGGQAKWNNSFGPRCYVSWYQPNVSDFSYSVLERAVGAGAYSTVGTYTGSPNSFQQFIDTNVSLSNYFDHGVNQASAVHYFRVTPYDKRGNAGTSTVISSTGQNSSVVRGFLTSPYRVNPGYTYNYSSGGQVWTSGQVLQGFTSLFNIQQSFGTFFYDTKRRTGLNISQSFILISRTDAGINDPIGAAIHLSRSTGGDVFSNLAPYDHRLTGGVVTDLLAKNTGTFSSIPTSWTSAIMNSSVVSGAVASSIQLYTGETENVGFLSHSLFFGGFRGAEFEDGFGNTGGTLYLYHSG